MRPYVAAFFVAALITMVLTPLVRRFALRIGAVAMPGGRHVHRRTVPRLGGASIFLAFVIAFLALYFGDRSIHEALRGNAERVIGVLLGGTVLFVVGAVDDTRGIRASYKLLFQVAVGAFAFWCGFRIDAISIPFGPPLQMGVFAFPVTLLWIVAVTNAVNLIDGLDGLAAGIVLFAGLTNLVVANVTGSVLVALVMSVVVGSTVGFLVFNFNPARIFMGDSGSYFLGYVLATTALVGSQKASTAVSLLVPCLALGVPIFDTLFTVVRRFLERRPLFSPDRGHLHHRLLDMGLTHRRAVLMIYAVSIVFSVAAIGVSIGQSWQVGAALFVASIVLFSLFRLAGYFEYLRTRLRRPEPLSNIRVELLRRALPDTPATLERTDSAEAMIARLGEIGRFDRLELIGSDGTRIDWERAKPVCSAADLLSSRFSVGDEPIARAELAFYWAPDDGETSPQIELLLQILTDVVERNLRRIKSPLAPRVSRIPSPRRSTPEHVAATTTLGSGPNLT